MRRRRRSADDAVSGYCGGGFGGAAMMSGTRCFRPGIGPGGAAPEAAAGAALGCAVTAVTGTPEAPVSSRFGCCRRIVPFLLFLCAGFALCNPAIAEYDEFGLVPGSGADELSIEDDILDPRWEAPQPPPRLPEGERGDDETLEEYLRAERDEPAAEEAEAASEDFHEDNWDRDKGAFPLSNTMDDELGDDVEDW